MKRITTLSFLAMGVIAVSTVRAQNDPNCAPPTITKCALEAGVYRVEWELSPNNAPGCCEATILRDGLSGEVLFQMPANVFAADVPCDSLSSERSFICVVCYDADGAEHEACCTARCDQQTTSVVGPNGGELDLQCELGQVSLSIPPNLIPNDVAVSLTNLGTDLPVQTDQGDAEAVLRVSLGPSQLVVPAPLLMTLCWRDRSDDGVVEQTQIREESLAIAINGRIVTGPCGISQGCDLDDNCFSVEVKEPGEVALVVPPAAAQLTFPAGLIENCSGVSTYPLILQADDPVSGLQLGIEWTDHPEIESVELLAGADIPANFIEKAFFVTQNEQVNIGRNQAVVNIVLNQGQTIDAKNGIRAVDLRFKLTGGSPEPISLQVIPSDSIGEPPTPNVVSVMTQNGPANVSPAVGPGAVTIAYDVTPPQIKCPEVLVVETGDLGGSIVEFEATAEDDCSGIATVTCTPPSGSLFDRGITEVICIAVDNAGNQSECRFRVDVAVRPDAFLRGDSNDDSQVDVSDVVRVLVALFFGNNLLTCPDAADSNDDSVVNIADPIHLLSYLFMDGAPIPPPGATLCGLDQTADKLSPCFQTTCDAEVDLIPVFEADLSANLLNWGFEFGLRYWEKTGDAFNTQPTYSHNVFAERVVGNGTRYSMPLGGDYWRQTSFPIGHRGNWWIGTHENRPSPDAPRGGVQNDKPIGTLTSTSFRITDAVDYITFLVGGGQDLERLKVELLEERPDGALVPLPGTARTGRKNELMRREWWHVAEHHGKVCRVRITDDSRDAWGHINVDDFRFVIDPPDKSLIQDGDVWRDPDMAVWGFADLHTHLAGHEAFDKKIFYGAPDGPIDQAIGDCNCSHGTFFNCIDGDLRRHLIVNSVGDGQNDHATVDHHKFHYKGFSEHRSELFVNWPAFNDATHQKMWWEWLQRAQEGGLRLIVALAHHNQLLARAPGGGEWDDLTALEVQIEEMKQFVARHDFMEIAYTPRELRRIVREEKLAVVLGSEIDNLGNFYRPYGTSTEDERYNPSPDPEEVVAEIDRLHELGIRYMFPIHLTDNLFGGTAIYESGFNKANKFYSNHAYQIETVHPSDKIDFELKRDGFDFAMDVLGALFAVTNGVHSDVVYWDNYPHYEQITPGHKNRIGLTGMGNLAVRAMMRRGMMLDIDHMSDKAVREMMVIAKSVSAGYPLNSGHNRFRSMGKTDENGRSDWHLEQLRLLGGMIGVGWGADSREFDTHGRCLLTGEEQSHVHSAVKNDCGGSSKSYAQDYLYGLAKLGGRNVAFGSDINSLVLGPGPRFGPYASYLLDEGPTAQVDSRVMCRDGEVRTISERNRRALRDVFNASQVNGVRYAGDPPGSDPSGTNVPLAVSSTAGKTWTVNQDGLAHYGLLPDLVQDLGNVGVHRDDLAPLFLSVEYFAQMWERCERFSTAVDDPSTSRLAFSFTPEPIGPLCPTALLAGDREFDGHGPQVEVTVSLHLSSDGRHVESTVAMHARETVSDWSETSGTWTQRVWTPPSGWRIVSIDSEDYSETSGLSEPGGFQFLLPGGSNPVNSWPIRGGLASSIYVVGDTGGDDISDDANCDDDTRVETVGFNLVTVTCERD